MRARISFNSLRRAFVEDDIGLKRFQRAGFQSGAQFTGGKIVEGRFREFFHRQNSFVAINLLKPEIRRARLNFKTVDLLL